MVQASHVVNNRSNTDPNIGYGSPLPSTPTSPEGPTIQESVKELNTVVTQFAADAGTSFFWTDVYPTQRQLVLAYINESLARLGLPLDNTPPGTAVSYPVVVLAKHRRIFDGAIWGILEDGGIVERRGDTFVRTSTPVNRTPSQLIYKMILDEQPLYANTHRLLNVTGSQFAECLTGAVDPIKLLFGQNKDLLQDFYTNAPMSVAASRHLTALLKRVFSHTSCRNGGPIKILEVGAGLGGTTKFVLDMLVEAKIPFKYTFTDISSAFFVAAKNRYKNLPPGSMDYLVLDIEKTPPEHLQHCFHAVISTNCIHATKNLMISCSNIRKLLRPGGFCALVEFTTRLYWLDLVFGLLDGWWLFEDGRGHCTTDESFWKTSLEAAGFSDTYWIEAVRDERPNPQLLVACTE